MSASPQKRTLLSVIGDVRFVPEPDIRLESSAKK
jgi:hypothetical protein